MAERTFKRFSDEQIDRANRVDVVEYARSVGLKVTGRGDWYKAKDQDGLYFKKSANVWHWESHNKGGRGAISLCMEYENKTWKEAVSTLLGEEMEEIRHAPDWKPEPEPPKEFHLPDRNYTYKHMSAYLTKTRGIDPGILKVLVDRGYVYENTMKSCVFVGRDKDGMAKHASVRSTNTEGKTFKQDVPGSQKAYSFSISGKSGVLNVLEAPIDVLSYISLQKLYGKQMKDSYVALGGVSDKALERFLTEYTNIEKIRVCTDNDPYLNPVWSAEESFDEEAEERVMKIEKTNMIKEMDDCIMFRTYSDYSRFIEKNPDASVDYVVFPKEQLTLSDEGIYTINIKGDQTYTLYPFSGNYERDAGREISGRDLYNRHFLKLPAGERAAFIIQEKYGEKYKVIRHRPTHKDFNEDLVAIRAQERLKQKEQAVTRKPQEEKQPEKMKADQEEQPPEQNHTGPQEEQQIPEQTEIWQQDKEILQQARISQKVLDWYENFPDAMPLSAEHFQIEGISPKVFVCENPVEVFSLLELRIQIYQAQCGEDGYFWKGHVRENYLVYSDIQHFNQYMQEHPGIEEVYLCGGQTAGGQKLNEEIYKGINSDKKLIFCKPEMNTYADVLGMKNTVAEVVEQMIMDDQQSLEAEEMNMAAGMEM